jgi:hydrogenase nickel incorporation protein HypA/HybF
MHELPVTQSILEIALRHARQAGSSRVVALNLTIGQLSSIVDDSIQFYWDIIAKDTIAEGARLVFNRVPIQLACLNCDRQYTPDQEDFACPACGSAQIKVISGKEFFLESIEVE